MSAHVIADVPPAPAPPPRGNRGQRLIRTVALAFAVAVFLAGVAVLLGPVLTKLDIIIPPDAVQVSASAAVDGRTLVSHKFTDAHTVADLYARINALPSTGGLRFSCMLAPPDPVRYTFHFTRWGMPVEDANPSGGGCYPRRWIVSRYGGWDLHMDFTGEQTKAILAEAQLPPLPS